ncbi:MAG: UDP-N-acetylmuramate dehydrogenase [Clostridia bacterium]|nr:UDP-N-acetylmuramate dehydrogenase [Clostridia bacterium]
MTDYNSIYNFALENGCQSVFDEPLNKHTSFKIGGKASLFVIPQSDEALSKLLKKCSDDNIRTVIIGNGSNLLVSDDGIDAVVIYTMRDNCEIRLLNETEIYCDAGASLTKVCRFALDNGLSGLEFAFGIPGSVGGAVYMNAGAYGGEIKDVITKCDYMTSDGVSAQMLKEEMALGYRTSIFNKNGCVITGAYFKLKKDSHESIKERMNDFLSRRKSKQPLEFPSAGSTFKRPEGHFAGALIEQSGLKGVSVGGAQVSEKHAGFVINKGNATAKDVMALVELIQKKVKEDSGVDLEPEIKIFS